MLDLTETAITPEVIVIGAGAAGLTALRELDRAGVRAICIEARDRIGGRILTVRPAGSPIPVELGAEFIHGRPREVWDIVSAARLGAYDCGEHAVYMDDGEVRTRDDAWLPIDQVISSMQRAAEDGPDIPFAEFLAGTDIAEETKEMATAYVQGFNAARADEIGIASLAQDAAAADGIDGDRSFRLLNGYDAVPQFIAAGIRDRHAKLFLHSVVEDILSQQGSASVHVRSALTGQRRKITARAVVVTVPLGVLQAGSIRFQPEPARTLRAANQLRFGQVVRAVLMFRDRIWERNPELADTGFILSREPVFPTWWTPLPIRTGIVTGWSAGPKADALIGLDRTAVIERAIQQFARITGIPAREVSESLEDAHFHDWHGDPFARGAYSYAPAGALPARAALAEPVSDTLFFAGEATETHGHSGTVHGAIATGKRVADDVLAAIR